MRSIWRTLDVALRRDLLAIVLAIGVVGLSFGAIALMLFARRLTR